MFFSNHGSYGTSTKTENLRHQSREFLATVAVKSGKNKTYLIWLQGQTTQAQTTRCNEPQPLIRRCGTSRLFSRPRCDPRKRVIDARK